MCIRDRFFSDDENMKMMAEIDKNNTCLLVKPSLKGLELNFDKDQLMKEDLSPVSYTHLADSGCTDFQ